MDEQLVARVKKLRLMDDIFFNRFMQDAPDCMEYILNIIMGRTDLKIQSLETQYDVPNIIARGVRFDAFCTDADGNAYDFEVQNDSDGASPKRASFYSSMMDAANSRRGITWDKLPDTYVIMFCEHDEIGLGQPLSIAKFQVQGTDRLLGDGKTIIYVNGQNKDTTTALGRLVADFHCMSPSEMQPTILASRAKLLKSSDEEVIAMCNLVKEYEEKGRLAGRAEGKAEGKLEGKLEQAMETVLNMINGQFDIKSIQIATKLPAEKIREIAAKNGLCIS